MLPTRVALVSYTTAPFPSADLERVATALQRQVTEDVNGTWGVEGIVAPFESFDDVPVGYIPLAIVDQDKLPGREHAFHFAPSGQPLGLVGNYKNWSVLASHELIEILCDPWGNRTAVGRSLRDDQGEVEYLVEVCDPCQKRTYTVNDVHVSDFVTPRYYDPDDPGGGPYSWKENITAPLQVLEGGYITWSVRRGDGQEIWQAKRNGDVSIEPLSTGTPIFTRGWVDLQSADYSGPVARAAATTSPAGSSANGYGAALQAEVDAVLASLDVPPTIPSFDQLLKLIEDLATNPSVYNAFEADPAGFLTGQGLNGSMFHFPAGEVPSQKRYEAVFNALNQIKQKGLGPGLDQPLVSTELQALAMHGST